MNPDWRAEADCRYMPTWLFYPEAGGDTRSADHHATVARYVCYGCPVRAECLATALMTHDRNGIWGGTNEKERRALLRQVAAGRSLAAVVADVCEPLAERRAG